MRVRGEQVNSDSLGADVANSIQDAFANQAANGPDKIALIFNGRPISYRELNLLAKKLADKIRFRRGEKAPCHPAAIRSQ